MWNYLILILIPVVMMSFNCEVAAPEEEEEEDEIKNLLLNPQANTGENYWTFYESGTSECGVDLMSSNIFYIEENNNEMACISQNVNLPAGSGGKYLLIIGCGWVEDDIPGFKTNHPYLWGEEFDTADGSLQYYNDTSLFHNGAERTWKTMYGIYQLNPTAVKISLFLWQANNVTQPTNGTRAAFDDLGVYIFNTPGEAEAFRDAYITAHPEVYE